MRIRLYDVTRITRTGLVPHSAIDAEDGAITAVYDTLPAEEPGVRSVDAKGAYAAPGFIDIHLHGGGGVEFMDATPERIRAGCAAHARHGTTTLLPTTLAASPELTLRMIRAVRQAQAATTECTIAGVHLEGPFLSPAQSGAQSPDALSLPTSGLWDRLLDEWPGGVRIMGAAPELPGAMALGETLRARGVVASIAHSDADYETCRRALACGFTDITHIYSGCSMVHRKNGYRFGGVVEAGLLEDAFTVQVIADGKHLPPELLRLIVKCKGADRISLITDALFAAGSDLPDGSVLRQANGMETVLEDGVMKLPDRQAFAGSVATMDRLVRNMVHLAGVPLWDAVAMATATPARVIGLADRKGSLAPGFDADIVLMSCEYSPAALLAKQLDNAGVKVALLGLGGVSNPALIELAGDSAEGIMCTSAFDPTNPDEGVQNFVKEYSEKFSINPNDVAAWSYETINAIAQAYEGGATKDNLMDWMRENTDYTGPTGGIKFDDKGENVKAKTYILKVIDGVYTLIG